MIPPVRQLSLFLAVAGAVGVFAALGALFGSCASMRPALTAGPAGGDGVAAAPAIPTERLFEDAAAVLLPPAPRAPGALAKRFRLAGTIFAGTSVGSDEPMAVLDDRVEVRQSVVSRNAEVIPGVVLTRVSADSVTLTGPDGPEEILLEKSVPTAATGVPETAEADAAAATASAGAAPGSRAEAAALFGGREVFPNRWCFNREQVLRYYDSLRSEPERLLQIFDSMDPVYVTDLDGESRIDGYRVGVEGEPDFFAAAGLRDGDVVKSVNKMLMTNRRRAEGLISAFIEGNGSLFVFEIERDGKTIQEVIEFE